MLFITRRKKSVTRNRIRNDRDDGFSGKDSERAVMTMFKYLKENMSIVRREMKDMINIHTEF